MQRLLGRIVPSMLVFNYGLLVILNVLLLDSLDGIVFRRLVAGAILMQMILRKALARGGSRLEPTTSQIRMLVALFGLIVLGLDGNPHSILSHMAVTAGSCCIIVHVTIALLKWSR